MQITKNGLPLLTNKFLFDWMRRLRHEEGHDCSRNPLKTLALPKHQFERDAVSDA
jgi:hypothetical protein